jgi:hypothetical protein
MKLKMKRAILGEIELTYNTDPTPTGAANALEVYDPSSPALELTQAARSPVRPFLGPDSTVVGATPYKLDFSVMLAGSGTAGTAPAYDCLLRACGLDGTNTPATSEVYAPVSSGYESITLYDNLDGVLHKGTGCRGNMSMEFAHGAIPSAKFSFTGNHVAPSDTSLPSLTLSAWQDGLIMNKVNTTVALHGETPVTSKISIDLGNKVSWKDFPNNAEEVRISDRGVKGSITVEADALSVANWFAIAKAGTLGALQIVHGTAAGNIVQIDAANVQLLDPKYEEVDGILTVSMDLLFVPGTSGNDELTITVK